MHQVCAYCAVGSSFYSLELAVRLSPLYYHRKSTIYNSIITIQRRKVRSRMVPEEKENRFWSGLKNEIFPL